MENNNILHDIAVQQINAFGLSIRTLILEAEDYINIFNETKKIHYLTQAQEYLNIAKRVAMFEEPAALVNYNSNENERS